MIIGTCYFPTIGKAERYYKPYEGQMTKEVVLRKLDEGKIHIGKPPLKSGDTLILIDNETRYAIVTNPEEVKGAKRK